MFQVDATHPIHSAILELLSRHGTMTTAYLHKVLQTECQIDITKQYLYRRLKEMLRAQILIKQSGLLSINLLWIAYLDFFCARARSNTSKDLLQHIHTGEKKMFKATNLLTVEALWHHILLQLYLINKEKKLYKYHSHAWWCLEQSPEKHAFYSNIRSKNVECHWLFGTNNPLNVIAADAMNAYFKCAAVDTEIFPKKGYNLHIFGPYIFECTLPRKISSAFEEIFSKYTTYNASAKKEIQQLLSKKQQYTMSVWRHPEQAKNLRNQLLEAYQ